MNIDRYMVNLFFEIRRNLPSKHQQALRLSAPDLGEKIVAIYQQSDDENTRLLIEIFLERAGDNWIHKVTKKKCDTKAISNKTKANYYRGVRLN